MTTRPCSKKRMAWRMKAQRACAFGSKVGIVAVEPIDTAMRFEVCFLHNAPRRSSHACSRGDAAPGAASRSLRLQRVAAQWYVAGVRVAIATTSRCVRRQSAGRLTGACGGISQATEALRKIATAPTTDGLPSPATSLATGRSDGWSGAAARMMT